MSTWVPENKRTTAWYLWNSKFHCRVSNIQTMSVEYLAEVGMPSIGDPIHDTQTANELVDRMLSVSQMVEYHQHGVNIHVIKYEDTKRIYELISNHLNAWKQQLENGFNIRGAPIEDLILLDKFANVVYKHAKYQFTTEMVDSIMARRMSTTLRANRTNLLRSEPKAVTINAQGETVVTETKYPERQSMDEAFKKYHRNGAGLATGSATSKWR